MWPWEAPGDNASIFHHPNPHARTQPASSTRASELVLGEAVPRLAQTVLLDKATGALGCRVVSCVCGQGPAGHPSLRFSEAHAHADLSSFSVSCTL